MSGWTLRMAPCGAVHTGGFIFPWQTSDRMPRLTASRKHAFYSFIRLSFKSIIEISLFFGLRGENTIIGLPRKVRPII